MTSMTSLWNGERAVVPLFVSRVVFSLLSHALALCFLAHAAFYVEIRLENFPPISQFKTRPGASSGMLLGAVTLPSVLISKLIQMSRALSFDEVRLEGLQPALMPFWLLSHGFAAVKLIERLLHTFHHVPLLGKHFY